ncbi:uncharacterized protein METZ01_LOCUS403712 [marine metagenome]|uniref:Uncharacterized protein n=1 Tax=marine metagenome TaxID=408172 RepID=A0A382VYA6_9ZZZZ
MTESGDSVIHTLLILFDLVVVLNLNDMCTQYCR